MTTNFNPNEFEGLRRLEGIKNFSDIWDTETFQEIQTELEKKRPNVSENFDKFDLSIESKRCFSNIRDFCNDVSDNFKEKSALLLHEYRNERRQISLKIVEYLLEKNFDMPHFKIIRDNNLNDVVSRDYGLEERDINDENFLVVFQLPKPLAQYWWKGGLIHGVNILRTWEVA